jgi:hypothetical protein
VVLGVAVQVARLAPAAARMGDKPAVARPDPPMRGLEAPESSVQAVRDWVALA